MQTEWPRRILVVAGLLEGEDGRLLIARRRAGDHLGLWWEFPGGKVEHGEAPEDALKREIKEELAVEVIVGDIFAVGHHVYPEREVVLLVYHARVPASARPEALEVEEFQWVTPEVLLSMPLPPADQPVLERLARVLARGGLSWSAT